MCGQKETMNTKNEIIDKHLNAILRCAGPSVSVDELRNALMVAVEELAPASAVSEGVAHYTQEQHDVRCAQSAAVIEAMPDEPEGEHLFELWWAEYMPEAEQYRAWAAWLAAPRSDGVGVAAPAGDHRIPGVGEMMTGELSDEKIDARLESIISPTGSPLKFHKGYPGVVDEMRAALRAVIAADRALRPVAAPAQAVYLVATGVAHEGLETYTRHDVCPPSCDAERLYTAAPAGIPAGWKLVPVEPSLEMWKVLVCWTESENARRLYRAILAVAPQPPAVQPAAGDILAPLQTAEGVHANMLAGKIAKISMAQCARTHGVPAGDVAMPVVAWHLVDQRCRAPDDCEDYERLALQSEIDSPELNRFLDAKRATGLIFKPDALAAMAAKDAELAEAKAGAQAGWVMLTNERIEKISEATFDEVADMPDGEVNGDTWDFCFARAIEAAVHAANPAL